MKQPWFLVIAALALLIAVAPILAQTGAWDLPWFTIDGGGSSSSGDRFVLSGTIGPPDGKGLSGGVYRLQGGFWRAASPGEYAVYLPLIVR